MLTSFPKGHKLTPRATPIHVSQLVAQYLRTVFAAQASTYPYKWTSNESTTGIVFDTVYNKESAVYGKKPIVIVHAGPIQSGIIVIDDLADHYIPTQNSMKTNLITSSVGVKILSSRHAEVEILRNEIFSCLVAIRTLLPAITNIHHVSGLTASEVQKFKLDDMMYVSDIQMQYSMQYVWTHLIPQEIMQEFIVYLNDKELVSNIQINNEQGD